MERRELSLGLGDNLEGWEGGSWEGGSKRRGYVCTDS